MNSILQFVKSQPKVAAIIGGALLLITIVTANRITANYREARAQAAVEEAQQKAIAAAFDPRVAQMMTQSAQNAPVPKYPVMPNQLRAMEGTLTYTYDYKKTGETEKREGQVKFRLSPQMGGLMADGIGSIKVDYSADSINPICRGVADHIVAKGDAKIEGGGAISPYGGVLELTFGGDLPVEETKLVPDGNQCANQLHHYPYHYGTTCRFESVDLLRGGKYSISKPDGGGGTTECILEIAPS